MSTIVTRLKNVTAPAGAPVILMPTDEEIALIQSPSLKGWFRPQSSYNKNGLWRDVKNDVGASLIRGAWPVYTQAGGLNGQPFIQQIAADQAVFMTQDNPDVTWPGVSSGGYTFGWVGSPSAEVQSSVQAIFATASATLSEVSYVGYGSSGDTIIAKNGSSTFMQHALGAVPSDHFVMISFDYVTRRCELHVNGSLLFFTQSVQNPALTRLALFGGMPPGGGGITAGSFRGRIYDLFEYDDALHKPINAEQLTALRTYIQARYGI